MNDNKRTAADWIKPEEAMPGRGVPVIIARVYEANAPLKVEQAYLEDVEQGWWKVFGTRIKTKSVVAWMPMPEPPEEV